MLRKSSNSCISSDEIIKAARIFLVQIGCGACIHIGIAIIEDYFTPGFSFLFFPLTCPSVNYCSVNVGESNTELGCGI